MNEVELKYLLEIISDKYYFDSSSDSFKSQCYKEKEILPLS
jgi:hypothetical protein